jgi:phosphoribosylformimino-5-aminoimidazole carboxamide ribotide isomerase
MLVIPAIDLKDGKCVRLRQGRMDEVTVFSEDPVEVARRWVAVGARRLHIVDLDGAVAGAPVHAEVIRAIADEHPDIPIQVGGGIRDDEAVESYLDAGVQYVIIGTRAVTAPHFVRDVCLAFPGHVLVGLDAKDGRLAIDGWSKMAGHDVVEVARQFEEDGVVAIIYTDIARDGMLSGINVDAVVRLAESIRIPVIAAGGLSTIDDVRRLAAAGDSGVIGAIAGRAIYDGTLDLAEALRVAGESGD